MEAKLKDDMTPEDFGIPTIEAQKARYYAQFLVSVERERCAHACREWQAGRLPHGIGTHDLLRAIEGPVA